MMSKYRSRALCILAVESVLTCLCCIAATWIRFGSEASTILLSLSGSLKVVVLMVVIHGSFYIFDLYDLQFIKSKATLNLRICQALGLASITLAALFYAVPEMRLGRGVFLVSVLLMLAAMVWWRLAVTWLLGHPKLSERVLILGAEKRAVDLAREALQRPDPDTRF